MVLLCDIEAVLLRLAKHLRAAHPAAQVRVLRREAAVAMDWQRVVRVLAPNCGDIDLQWNSPALRHFSLDKEVLASVAKRGPAGPASAVQWTSWPASLFACDMERPRPSPSQAASGCCATSCVALASLRCRRFTAPPAN